MSRANQPGVLVFGSFGMLTDVGKLLSVRQQLSHLKAVLKPDWIRFTRTLNFLPGRASPLLLPAPSQKECLPATTPQSLQSRTIPIWECGIRSKNAPSKAPPDRSLLRSVLRPPKSELLPTEIGSGSLGLSPPTPS